MSAPRQCLGAPPPQKDEGPSVRTAEAPKGQNSQRNSEAARRLVQALSKDEAGVAAKAALIGAQFVRSTDDRDRPVYVVSRWAFTRTFANLDEAEAFVQQIGGAA